MNAAFAGQSNGLCGGGQPGRLFFVTGTHTGKVQLTVEFTATRPEVEPTWEEQVECSFEVKAGPIHLRDWEGLLSHDHRRPGAAGQQHRLSRAHSHEPDRTTEAQVKRVTGIGGVFFNANDPVALRAWYERHLGIDVQDWGGTAFTSLDAAGNPTGATIVWSIGAADNTQFAPSKATFMINYRVEDLDAVLRALQNEGCNVLEKTDNSGHGKFAWVMDPEGNKIELWQESSGKPRVPDADFFRALEVERTQALVARDVTTIRRLHAPDYELISVPGRVMSLERYLSLMRSPAPAFAASKPR